MNKSLKEKRDELAWNLCENDQDRDNLSFKLGFDAGIQAERDRSQILLDVLKKVYLKHNLGDDSIGWEELGTIVHSTICNEIGDDAFCDWLEKYKGH
jgi:hypothetical protein